MRNNNHQFCTDRKKSGLRSRVRVNLRMGDYDNLPESISADFFA